MIRSMGIRAAVAASLVVAALGVWQMARPRSVFARAAAAMAEAKGFRCDISMVVRGPDGHEEVMLVGRQFWSAIGGDRFESVARPEAAIEIRPPGKPGLRVLQQAREYQVLARVYDQPFNFGLFARLEQLKAQAGPPVRTTEVEGHPAEEYVVPWSRVLPDPDHSAGRMRMWLDPTTNLPLRVDVEGLGPKEGDVFRLTAFRWGDQDASLFSTEPPAGYTRRPTQDFQADQITAYVVFGLKTFARYNQGRYPTVKYVYGDEQGEALRKLMGMDAKASGWRVPPRDQPWDRDKADEFAHGSYGMSWINSLQRENPDCRYNGRTVTPQDAGKVLLRWQLDDGASRVIYGDLHTETVTPARLKELEAH